LKSFEEKLKRDWRDDSEIESLCESIFAFLSDEKNHRNHFSYSDFRTITNAKNDEKLSRALQYLSAPGRRVLKKVFFFFDLDDVVEYSSVEMTEIFQTGAFAHPRTGEEIFDLNRIQVAFEVGEKMKRPDVNRGANE
jgi:hypothetical protein